VVGNDVLLSKARQAFESQEVKVDPGMKKIAP
jgi:hypothetical protein